MTITPTTTTALLLEQPQTDEQAAFLIDAGDHAMRMGLKYFINEKKLTSVRKVHDRIHELNPDSLITIHQLNRLAGKMRDEGELERHSGSGRPKAISQPCEKPVENPKQEDVIDVEVMQPERLPGETFIQMKQRQRNNNTHATDTNVRRHQLERINQRPDDGVLTRAEWYIPDHIEDREAHAAYQRIIGLLDEAALLANKWMLTRRIDDIQWDEIAGHSQVITSFANCRQSDVTDAEPSPDRADGITIDIAAEGT